jgi:uncharacterized protein
VTALLLASVGLLAGLAGALMGIGGGVIVIPALTLGFGLPFRHAVAISLVVIIASSSASAATYVDRKLSDLRVGVVLELATVAGAMAGGAMAASVPLGLLKALFAAVSLWTAFALYARRAAASDDEGRVYVVRRWWAGLSASAVAGAVSGLIGVGGGFLKVPVMTLAMGLPFKVATATSNFMIGVTAAASAYLYFARGELELAVAAPVVVGVFIGARAGTGLLPRIPARRLQAAFAALLVVVGGRMAWDVLGGLR